MILVQYFHNLQATKRDKQINFDYEIIVLLVLFIFFFGTVVINKNISHRKLLIDKQKYL